MEGVKQAALGSVGKGRGHAAGGAGAIECKTEGAGRHSKPCVGAMAAGIGGQGGRSDKKGEAGGGGNACDDPGGEPLAGSKPGSSGGGMRVPVGDGGLARGEVNQI